MAKFSETIDEFTTNHPIISGIATTAAGVLAVDGARAGFRALKSAVSISTDAAADEAASSAFSSGCGLMRF